MAFQMAVHLFEGSEAEHVRKGPDKASPGQHYLLYEGVVKPIVITA